MHVGESQYRICTNLDYRAPRMPKAVAAEIKAAGWFDKSRKLYATRQAADRAFAKWPAEVAKWFKVSEVAPLYF